MARGLKGIQRLRKGRKVYLYHRATGTRLPDLPESDPRFLEAYLKAERQQGSPQRPGKARVGTLKALWHDYLRSAAFKALSPAYARLQWRDGDKLIEIGGHVPYATIQTKHIRADLAALAPHAATKRLKTWRAVMRYALAAGLIDSDPTQGIARPKAPKAQSYPPWTPDEIENFRAHWPIGTAQRLAFELLHWTGARMSDMVRLGDGMVDSEGWLCFCQRKTGDEVAIPLRRDVPPIADPDDLAQLHQAMMAMPRHMTYLTTSTGKSRSEKSASQWFAKAAREAGIEGKSGHGLRTTRAVKLSEAGATAHQIGAWTGHRSLAEIAHYTQRADRRRILSGTGGERKNVNPIVEFTKRSEK